MKKVLCLIAAAAFLFAGTDANAQLLGKILGGGSSSSSQSSSSSSAASTAGSILTGILGGESSDGSAAGSILTGVLNSVAGTVYSAPISLNGTYIYNGLALSTSSSEASLLSNLAGGAINSGIENKINGVIEKIGIKPGSMTFVFNSDETFTCSILNIPVNGTYKVGENENTVTLTFGKIMQFFTMTGTLESGLTEAKMLFPATKMTQFFKKVASLVGKKSSTVSSLSTLTGSYDNFKMGFKLAKQ